MKTITKQINVFSFSELSPKAKEYAKEQYAQHSGYPFDDDALASLSALAEHFQGKLTRYSLDFFGGTYSEARFDMPDMEPKEIERLLAQLGAFNPETLKGKGDCVLTGYCSDENAIDGFRIAWHRGERDLGKLMQAAFATWLADAQSDCSAYYSDEVFSETMDANEMEFTEDGRIFRQ